MGFDKELATNPNKYADKFSYKNERELVYVNGYQSFIYNKKKKSISINKSDQTTNIKKKLVESAFLRGSLKGKTVLDLGGNNGLYSLCSLIKGANKAHVVDIDIEAIKNVNQIASDVSINKLSGSCSNISELSKKEDIVIALALVHWIFDLTTGFGSLKSVINFLRGLTKEALIIEWVDPNDPLIINYKHTSTAINSNEISNFKEENFINLLSSSFDNLEFVGSLSSTRKIYLAYDDNFLIPKDLEWFKLIFPAEKIITSKPLCRNPDGDIIFSRVYELKDKFVKQTNLEIGQNERNALNSLDHPSIPKLLSYEEQSDYSVLEIEKASGQTLSKIIKSSNKISDQDLFELAYQLKNSLKYIHLNGIEHKDITPDNLIWCNTSKKLSIIDFGWSAVKNYTQIFTPPTLGKNDNYGFYGYIDQKQKRSDNYAAAILLSFLIKDRSLEQVEEIIQELIIDGLSKNKFDLKNFLLSIQNLQKSFSNILIEDENLENKNKNLKESFSKLLIKNDNLESKNKSLEESSSNLLIKNKNLEIQISANKDNISEIINSNSWKLTKPLRVISRKFKKSSEHIKIIIYKFKTLIKIFS
tara:strand:+ start:4783 stop:6543 length:1761 start_codon:yes stop_codon:yes gene_type:complete